MADSKTKDIQFQKAKYKNFIKFNPTQFRLKLKEKLQ